MKGKYLLMLGAVLYTAHVNAQKTKPAVKPKPKVAVSPLKNLVDSASYALGQNVGRTLQQQGFTGLNNTLFNKGLTDQFGAKPSLISQAEGNNAVQELYMKNLYKKYPALAEGEKFLAENGKRPGVITLPSGLQYEVLEKGDTAARFPTMADTVVVHYIGSLVNGTVFENSYQSGRPAVFTLTQVIPGWTEVLQLMRVGDKFKAYIPTQMAYDLNPRDPNQIPPGSALVFMMALEGIKPAANLPAAPTVAPMGGN